MAWTQADVDKLKSAILALACGEMVQTVRFDGPPSRMVTYHPADLDKMRSALSLMESDVARSAGKSTIRYLSTKKGF